MVDFEKMLKDEQKKEKNMTKNNVNKQKTKPEEDKYPEKTVEQTISTKVPLFGRVSNSGEYFVMGNSTGYDFVLIMDKQALLDVLEGTGDKDYVFVNPIINDDED